MRATTANRTRSSVTENLRSPCRIRGMDCITPVGNSLEETFASVVEGVRNFSRETGFFVARVESVSGASDRQARMLEELIGRSWVAAALEDTEPDRRGLVLAMSKGRIDRVIEALESRVLCPRDLMGTDITSLVAGRLNLTGPRLGVVTACASSLHAVIRGVQLIEDGMADSVVAAAVESSIHPFLLHAYNNMGALAGSPQEFVPFRTGSRGFIMGEGAGLLVLSSTGQGGGVVVKRKCMVQDTYHITRNDPSGVPLEQMLEAVVPDTRGTVLVRAHGTGTVANDELERKVYGRLAARRVCREVLVCGSKYCTGHLLGAAGIVETALAAESLNRGVIPPMHGASNHPDQGMRIVTKPEATTDIETVVVTGLGFGGHVAGMSLSKTET